MPEMYACSNSAPSRNGEFYDSHRLCKYKYHSMESTVTIIGLIVDTFHLYY